MKNNINDFCEKYKLTLNQFLGIDKIEGSLDLHSVTTLPDGFNPTVGGNLDLNYGLSCNYTKLPSDSIISWCNGKYILVDGIFTEVVSHRGNVYRVKKLNSNTIFYLVTDGVKYSHGSTLKEAKLDLIYKISNKSKDSYKDYTLDSVVTFEEGIECYRVLTGACSFGTKDFVTHRLVDRKSKYKISEIIELTRKEYRNEVFKEFFVK